MHFKFKPEKTIEAIGVLLREEKRDRMNYMRLLKLLYFADRESLREVGRPITGDRAVAMERGPVLEEVYDLIRGEHVVLSVWSRFFETENYEIRQVKRPGVSHLSRFEIEKLKEISHRFNDKDEWAMVDEAHKLPEWRSNNPGKSSRPIPLEDILHAIGRSGACKAIIQAAKDDAAFDRLLEESTMPKASPRSAVRGRR